MSGNALPTVAEQSEFTTKEVVIPNTPTLFEYMLQSTSAVVDVIQGNTHPHAIELRRFVKQDVPRIVRMVEGSTADVQAVVGNVYPRLLHEIQLTMVMYYQDLLCEREPQVTGYGNLLTLVQRRKFHELAELPYKYRVTASGGVAARPGTGSGRGGGQHNGTNTPNTALGQQVTNDQPTNCSWMTKFKDSKRMIRDLRAHAPKDTNGAELCLSFHLKGTCYTNCRWKASHRVLMGATKRAFQTFIDTHIGGSAAATEQPNSGQADGEGNQA
jgi:hypothetical protein